MQTAKFTSVIHTKQKKKNPGQVASPIAGHTHLSCTYLVLSIFRTVNIDFRLQTLFFLRGNSFSEHYTHLTNNEHRRTLKYRFQIFVLIF